MSLTEQVWIVDDDSSIRWVMEKALTRAGVACRAFETGTDVLEALSVEEPIVVVSDIRMPGMDGLAMLKRLREDTPGDRELEVVVITGHAGRQEAVEALGFDQAPDFLVENVRPCGRDHGLENLLLAVIAVEPAGPRRNRKCRKAVLVAAAQLGAAVFLEGRRRKANRPRLGGPSLPLELIDEHPIEFGVLQVLDPAQRIKPCHKLFP